MDIKQYTADFLGRLAKRDPAQKVFQQAVHEVVGSLAPVLEQNPKYIKESILDRILEPERMIISAFPGKTTKAISTSTAASAFSITARWGLTKAACDFTKPSTRTR